MTVRTALLAANSSGPANTVNVIYTCPVGKTTIVKDIRLTGNANPSCTYSLIARSGPRFIYLLKGTIAIDATPSAQGFIVLEPGDTLQVLVSAADGIGFRISGSELEGVAP